MHIILQHLLLCFVQQVSERLDVSFVFSDAVLYYICIQPAGPWEPLLANSTTVWNKKIQEALPKARENGYGSGAMTKWIKLQSSVGSRAAERMRRDEGGGGGDREERETKERRDRRYWRSQPKYLPRGPLSVSLTLFINSPPSSPLKSHSRASSWSLCSYEPVGFAGIGSRGIITFHSTKAVEW